MKREQLRILKGRDDSYRVMRNGKCIAADPVLALAKDKARHHMQTCHADHSGIQFMEVEE